MDPTLSSTPLEHPLYLKPGFSREVLHTVGEAAVFIKQLPAKYDGVLHWSSAGAAVEDAARRFDSADALRIELWAKVGDGMKG
jgi:hypothetical protein